MSIVSKRLKPKLGLAMAGTLMTPEEFDGVTDYDERYGYELVRGVLVVTPIPSEGECDPNEELGFLLRDYQINHPSGSALDLTLPERYVPVPDGRRKADRVIWAGLGRRPDPARDLPTIAVEFVSKARRDRVRDYEEKLGEYLSLGVREYWIIDRFQRIMTVYKHNNLPGSAQEIDAVIISEAEIYRTELLAGFELPLGRLLAVADKWA